MFRKPAIFHVGLKQKGRYSGGGSASELGRGGKSNQLERRKALGKHMKRRRKRGNVGMERGN